MKKLFLSIIILSFTTLSFAQENENYENVKLTAAQFLNSAANQLVISSELISVESLDKSKELNLSMALEYDSTGNTNGMMLLPGNKIKEISSAEMWDYMQNIAQTMEKRENSIEWNIEKVEIKDDLAFVKYEVKNRETKIMQLRRENDNWKVILSFNSIF